MPGHERNWVLLRRPNGIFINICGSRRPVGRLVFDRDIADYGVRAAIEAVLPKALPIRH